MENKIFITSKNVYGRTLYYPDCDTSKMFLMIQGGKTLSLYTLSVLENKGFAIKEKAKSFNSNLLLDC
jgi:hypothetical protein